MTQYLYRVILFSFCLLFPLTLSGGWGPAGYENDLMHDLMIVEAVNCKLSDRMPTYYNHLLQGGYFNMPSARMGCEGEVGVGYSYVKPYRNINLRFQFLDRLEVSGNYRVFHGIDDPMLSPTGFGDKSDKGANVKLALMHPEDSNYCLPGFAIGYEDFMGTKGFEANYVVMTQVLPKWNFEFSVGYGEKRIGRWFGGAMWLPFRKSCCSYLQGLAFVAEYDAIKYKSEKREPHPDGRSVKSRINYGVKYRLWDLFDFSLSHNKGEDLAFSFSTVYNFGTSRGIIPKLDNPLPYRSPKNTQPLGCMRPKDVFTNELYCAFKRQGLHLREAWLDRDCCCRKILRVSIENCMFRYEQEVRDQLNDILASLIPVDIHKVIVTLEERTLPLQEYHFPMDFVRLYAEKKVCPYELYVLSPLHEASLPSCSHSELIFKDCRNWWNIEVFPKTHTLFGSARGKFKYSLGAYLGVNGYLWNDLFYNALFGYTLVSDLYDVKDVDKLNPSQIINVRTDMVNYYKQDGVTVDELYLQKSWSLCRGWYLRVAGGLFEVAYGGIAGEVLYYPVNSNWAVGIEGAYLRKRTFSGIGFSENIRKLEEYQPTYQRFRGSQYFLSYYYNFADLDLDLYVKGGKFLANDWGARTEISRNYPSGMRFFMWFTYTNGKDYVNGERYHDKGVGMSIPLDIFYTCTCRNFWHYGLSAWLRDVGAQACTGIPLYPVLRDNRENLIR